MKIRRLTGTGEWTTRRYLSLVGNILIWVIVAIDAFYLWPAQLHGSTSMVIVSGHSMEPTYFTGDLVIARKMKPSVGDVIVYAPANLGGSQIIHRIIGGNATDGWQMQGDNNGFVDPFTPKGSEVKGVVLVHYASFGRVTALLLNPLVWAFVLLLAIVLLVWWSGDTCEDDDKDEGKGNGKGEGDPEPVPEEDLDLIDRVVEGTEAAIARTVDASADAAAAVLAMLTRPSPAPRHAASSPRHTASSPRRTAPGLLRSAAILAVLGLLAIYDPSTASASQLVVKTGSQISVTTLKKCSTQTLTANLPQVNGNNYAAVVIGNIGLACQGMSIAVDMYDTNGTPLTTGSGTVTGTSTAVPTVSTYHRQNVGTVVVKIDGWIFVAVWSDTAPPTFYNNCLGNATACAIAQANNPAATLTVNGGGTWQTVQLQVSGQGPNTS